MQQQNRYNSNDDYINDENSEEQLYANAVMLRRLIAFFFTEAAIILFFNYTHIFKGIESILLASLILFCNALVFCIVLKKYLKPVLKWPHFSIKNLLLYCLLAVVAAVIVNYIISWLNQSVFNRDATFYQNFVTLQYPVLAMVLIVAVLPAFVEELGYRGILQTGLSQIIGVKKANRLTSFMFAILHINFISFFWLLPFAFALGLIRQKHQTIWYGVAIHFCFNVTACIIELRNVGLL
jgi:uncharacterized protein